MITVQEFTVEVQNMTFFAFAARCSRVPWPRFSWSSLFVLVLLSAAGGSLTQRLSAAQSVPAQAPSAPAPTYQLQTPAQLQQAVAPLALYPDSLVAQVLAASTFPEQVVEADRWLQANPDLKGNALGQAVDQQSWDPSVKALTAFPSVLGNMDKNLAWTSSLGDAYYNQPQDVMDAVQVMRRRAQAAGNLKTTPQQTVATQGSSITIEPDDPNTVYVPAYDPWSNYGTPVAPWPGWYAYPGIWFNGPSLSFGVGFGIGLFGGFAWGWPHWGFDWSNRAVMYNHNQYYSRSNTFFNRGAFYRGGGAGGVRARSIAGSRPPTGNIGGRGGTYRRPAAAPQPFSANRKDARGYAEPRGQSGVSSSAFSGYQHGGQARSDAARGSGSMGRAPARASGGMGHGAGVHRF
jgi:hypothetical protein